MQSMTERKRVAGRDVVDVVVMDRAQLMSYRDRLCKMQGGSLTQNPSQRQIENMFGRTSDQLARLDDAVTVLNQLSVWGIRLDSVKQVAVEQPHESSPQELVYEIKGVTRHGSKETIVFDSRHLQRQDA